MSRKKKILILINTLGRGGAEIALLNFIRQFDPEEYEISLYVMLGQGELIGRVPEYVKVLNREFDPTEVLSARGSRALIRHTLHRALRRGALARNLTYLVKNFPACLRGGGLKVLLWKVIADGTPQLGERFQLAVAYLEGASTYYLARKVDAARKVAFFHTDYKRAGYTRALDGDAYERIDLVYCVSDETKAAFLEAYPELEETTDVFRNILNEEEILRRGAAPGGFEGDGYTGVRIVTLGRLEKVKAVSLAVRTMAVLRDRGFDARWYVFGEGSERAALEKEIAALGLKDRFFLPGAKDDPFPYLKQADIYVQCSEYEGSSMAIKEAQLLGRPVVVSDRGGNSGMVVHGETGLLVQDLTPETIADSVGMLIRDPAARERLGNNAAESMKRELEEDDFHKILKDLERE